MNSKRVSKDNSYVPKTKMKWVETTKLDNLGHGVQFFHDCVHGTPVAFIDGYDWLHDSNPEILVTVWVLKPTPAHPVKISVLTPREMEELFDGPPTKRSKSKRHQGESSLGQEEPPSWTQVVDEVKGAIVYFLRIGGPTLGRVKGRVRVLLNA